MAGRIRSIKPELREHLPFASLSDGAARLYLMLFTLADDAGRCPASAGFLAGAVFYAKPRSTASIGRLIAEISAAGLVRLYHVNGAPFVEIVDWRVRGSVVHQRIDKPQPERYPGPTSVHSANGSENDSKTDSRTDLDLDLDRERDREAKSNRSLPPGPAAAPDPTAAGTADPALRSQEARPESPELAALKRKTDANAQATAAADPRRKVNHDAWAYASATHAKLRAEGVDPHAIAWTAIPVGAAASDLIARTRELMPEPSAPGAAASALEVHRRRVDVAAAESRREQHLRWFTPSRIYARESFWKAAEMDPRQIAGSAPRGEQPTLRVGHGATDDGYADTRAGWGSLIGEGWDGTS